MVNKLKIITMTQLALYDKHEGPADRVANDYFRHDYIYKNNLGTRLSVGLGSIIILAIYWIHAFSISDMDVFDFNIQEHLTESVFFLLAILAVYSLIGSIQGTRRYYLVQKRLSQYQAIVRQLERLNERELQPFDEEHDAEVRIDKNKNEYQTQKNNTAPLVRTNPTKQTRHINSRPQMQPLNHLGHTRSVQPQPPEYTRSRPRPHHPNPAERINVSGETIPSDIKRPIERTLAPRPIRPIERARPPSLNPTRTVEHTRHKAPDHPIEHTRVSDAHLSTESSISTAPPRPKD